MEYSHKGALKDSSLVKNSELYVLRELNKVLLSFFSFLTKLIWLISEICLAEFVTRILVMSLPDLPCNFKEMQSSSIPSTLLALLRLLVFRN